MWHWLISVVLLFGATGCSTITQWRQRSTIAQIDHIFSECEAKRGGGSAGWTETVRCGNDGVQALVEKNGSAYAGLIEAALASRLTIAQQIDAGAIAEEAGKARIALLNAHIQALPGSTLEILSLTAAAKSR